MNFRPRPDRLLDTWVTTYQFVCFPIFGISPVRRSAYIVIDRHRLGYLNAIEKLNCVYCASCGHDVDLRGRLGARYDDTQQSVTAVG